MKTYLHKVLTITGDMKKKLPLMLGLYFVTLALELVGLSLIIPFITVLQSPDQLSKYEFWNFFAGTFNIQTGLSALILLSCLVLFVYFLKTVLNIFTQKLILGFSYDMQVYLREKFARFYIYAPYLFHTKRRSNEILNILMSHINQFPKAVVGALLRITGEVATIVSILIFLLISYPIPTLTALVMLVVFGFFYDVFVRRKLKKAGEEIITANNDLIRSTRQGIHSLKEARILGCSEYFLNQIKDSSYRAAHMNAFVAVMQMIPRYVLEFLIVFIVVLSSVLTLLLQENSGEIIDGMAVFAVAAIRLLPSANQIITNIGSLRYSGKIVDELYNDYQELSRTEGARTSNNKITFTGAEFRNICFCYPDTRKKVLDNVNIAFKKGEVIGISGPSGSGKSTLADIILGLIKADTGEITLNGNTVNANQWTGHQMAAYIPQDPALLDDTILNNVALGQNTEHIDKDRAEKALQKSHLWDFVQTLPEGINANVGEDAILLSGGQRQRLAMARAFYFHREIIVLDEATSALDKETEAEIITAVKDMKKEAAILIVSHNDQPLQICDRICYLSPNGTVKKAKS